METTIHCLEGERTQSISILLLEHYSVQMVSIVHELSGMHKSLPSYVK